MQDEEQEVIKLDGSLGLGSNATFVVITKDDILGDKREEFTFPYALINFDILTKYLNMNLILGYEVRRHAPIDKGE